MTKPTEFDLLVLTLIAVLSTAHRWPPCSKPASLYTPEHSHMLAQGLVSLMVVPGTTGTGHRQAAGPQGSSQMVVLAPGT